MGRGERQPIKNLKLCVIALVIVVSIVTVSGCARYYQQNYYVNITGLDKYQGNGTTRILVPAPVMGSEPVFSSGKCEGWNISFVNHTYGPMVEFSTVQSNLTNISAEFSTGSGYRPAGYDAGAYTTGTYLAPNYTLLSLREPGKNDRPREYSSFIYLDENISSVDSSLPPIALDLRFEAKYLEAGQGDIQTRKIRINDVISPGIKGQVPVIVRVLDWAK